MSRIRQVLIAVVCLTILAIPFSAQAAAGDGKKIGVLWFGKSGMAKRVFKGMSDVLSSEAPGLEVEVIKELPDEEAASKQYQSFLANKDAVVFLRSNGAKHLGKNPPSKPAFIGGTNNPVELGAVKSMEKPEGNITGVTYYLPAEEHFKYYEAILPNTKSVGILLEKGHPSSAIDQRETKAACKKRSWKYSEAICETKEEIAEATKKFKAEGVDLVIMGNQAKIFENSAVVAPLTKGMAVASYSDKPVTNKHALCSLGVSDEKLGNILGESIISVVIKGKKVSEVPVKTDPKPTFVLNVVKATELELEIPSVLLDNAKIIE